MKLRLKEVPDLEHHITTQINPQLLIDNKVPVVKTTQGYFSVNARKDSETAALGGY